MKDLVTTAKTAAKQDWSLPKLSEVCRLINGRAYKKNELLQEGRYRVLRVGNFFTNQNWYFSDLKLDPDKYCEDGDLLYAWSASFGPRIWRGEKTIYHYHIWKVEPDRRKVLRDFLYYFFEWDKELIREEQGAGATMIHVSKKSMDARAIPLPPLEEQKRIVAVLDHAFAALDRARAHAEANLADASVLRAEAANELLQRATGSAERKLLATIADFRNGLNFSRHSSGDRVRVVGVGDFQKNFWVPIEKLKETHVEGRLSEHDKLRHHDIVSVRSNGNKDLIGRVMLVGEIDENVSFSGFVIRIRLKSEEVLPEYVCHYMKSPEAGAHLRAGGGGVNISNLNQGILSSLSVPVPCIEVQSTLVEDIHRVNERAIQLQVQIENKLADISALRQSLLQQAFSGQLT